MGKGMDKLGAWAFVGGLALAIIIAIVSASAPPTWAVWLLALIGVVVGLLNVGDHEVQLFLVAGIAFLLSFQALSTIIRSLALGWESVSTFFGLVGVFIAPAIAIVAVKALFVLSKD